MGIAIIVITVLAAGAALIWGLRKERESDEKLAGDLDVGIDRMRSRRVYERELDGHKFFLKYKKTKSKKDSALEVWVNCDSRSAFEISTESGLDRFFKRVGMSVEIQTGDSAFDKDFYIITDSAVFTRRFLAASANRAAIRALFQLECEKVEHDGKTMRVRLYPHKTKQTGQSLLQPIVDHLATLAGDLPRGAHDRGAPILPPWKIKRYAVYAISIFSAVGGLLIFLFVTGSYRPLDSGDVFRFSLIFSVPAFVAFVVASLFLLRGRSSSHIHFIASFFVALFGFPLLSHNGAIFLNGYLDSSPTVSHGMPVISKRRAKRKSRKGRVRYSYYVTVKSWRPNRDREELRVSESFYYEVRGNSVIRIGTRPGHFGFEWIESAPTLM